MIKRSKTFFSIMIILLLFSQSVFASSNTFKTVKTFENNTIFDICVSNNKQLIAVGDYGLIEKSNDGKSWSEIDNDIEADLYSVACSSDKYIAVGDMGTILKSTNGSKWDKIDLDFGYSLYDVEYIKNKFYAAGEFGNVLTSSNGENWKEIKLETTNEIYAIAYAINKYIAVGRKGTMFTSKSGTDWEKIDLSTNADLYDVIFANKKLWVVGENGTVFTSTDAKKWSKKEINIDSSFNKIAYYKDNYYIASEYGSVLSSTDGELWSLSNSNLSSDIFEVVGFNDRIIAAGDGGISASNISENQLFIPQDENPSSWAVSEIEKAIEHELVPQNLLQDFQKNITRQEFCELIVIMIEKISNENIETGSTNPFIDTHNSDILKAYKMKIVNGVSQDKFAPNNNITRQEIGTMFFRAIKAVRNDISLSTSGAPVFSDESKMSSWAKEAIKFTSKNNIINGVGGNRFAPLDNATREQAIALVVRTYEKYKK